MGINDNNGVNEGNELKARNTGKAIYFNFSYQMLFISTERPILLTDAFPIIRHNTVLWSVSFQYSLFFDRSFPFAFSEDSYSDRMFS